MQLKSLQMQGFKSFPDKITIEFSKGVTAIVGPNGSGKSNISDAVRWVLGEQSPRVLRVKSTEDVIFKGTTERKAQGLAEVILNFDNSDRELKVNNDDVSIMRRYYRSGKSEYKINGETVRLQDITKLFLDTGLGKSGYSMIEQYKIAALVDSRSDERRTIIEEASGISKYRYSRAEALRELARAEDNLVHLRVRLTDLEERDGPLEKESEKAKKYLELRAEREAVEVGLWLATLAVSNSELRDIDYNITLYSNQQREIEEKIRMAEEAVVSLMEQSNALNVKKDEVIRSASEVEAQAIRTENEAAIIKNDIEHAKADISRLEGQLSAFSQDEEQQEEEIAEKQRILDAKRLEIISLGTLREKKKEELESLSSKVSGFSKQLEELNARQNTIAIALSEARVRLAGAKEQLADLEERQNAFVHTEAENTKAVERLSSEKKQTEEAIEAAEDKISSLTNTVGGYRLRLDKQKAKLEEAKRITDSHLQSISECQSKIKIIDDLEKSMGGFAYSVKKVVESCSKGQLRGIHGPVSRLIEVESEYATAIEIALGAGLQNIVVDNEDSAKAAINFLKRENAGRATFLPLTTIKANKLHEPSLENFDGFIGLGCELVNCDSKYRNIVDNLLGRIVIAEDMNTGNVIAKKFGYRFKIVTLDGQVFNAGGSMTGGSVNAKTSGVLGRRSEIESLKNTVAKLEKEAEAAKTVQKELAAKVASDEAALLGAQGELATAQQDLNDFKTSLRIISEQLESAYRDRTSIESQRTAAKQREKSLGEFVAEQESKIASLSDESTKLESEISGNAAERGELRDSRNALTEQLGDIGMKLMSEQKECEAIESSIAEIRLRISNRSNQREDIKREIEEKEQEILRLSGSAEQQLENAEAMRRQAEEMRASVGTVNQERMSIEGQITVQTKLSGELGDSKAAVMKELGRCETQRQNKQAEYDNIISKLFSEYEMTLHEAEDKYEPVEDRKNAQKKANELRAAMKKLEPVNINAIDEYIKVHNDYVTFKTQMEDVETSKAELEKLIEQLTSSMKDMFTEKFAEISKAFEKICPQLFGGGSAEIKLTDETDPLGSGIDMNVALPGKVVDNMLSFSNGEKTIIAMALYFSIMKVTPSPFVFLDEIDAPLDESNIINIADYIVRMSDKTQFITITHRRGMMEKGSTLYGVTMQKDGESKLLELKVSEIEEKLGL